METTVPADSDPKPNVPALIGFLDHFAPALMAPALTTEWTDRQGRFLTVLVRTTGKRPKELQEALLCLASQTSREFSVLVMTHNASDEQFERTCRQVDQFREISGLPATAHRVEGGYRGQPLHDGVLMADSRYAVILDDDDYVTADWVELFADLESRAPGRVLRTEAVTRVMEHTTGALGTTRVCVTPDELEYGAEWSVRNHLVINQTPIHAFAFPLFPVRKLGVQFRTDIPVVEDWDFLMRIAIVCGVIDARRPTAVYNRHDVDSSVRHHAADEWRIAEASVRGGLRGHLLVEAAELEGSTPIVHQAQEQTSLRHKWNRARVLLDEGGSKALAAAVRSKIKRR
jgi:hypothetical protein